LIQKGREEAAGAEDDERPAIERIVAEAISSVIIVRESGGGGR